MRLAPRLLHKWYSIPNNRLLLKLKHYNAITGCEINTIEPSLVFFSKIHIENYLCFISYGILNHASNNLIKIDISAYIPRNQN